jgi:lysophospholipase
VPEPAPFLADIAEGPAGGRACWLRAADGVRLRACVWPEGEKGTVLLFPGRTEYIEKYSRPAAELAARGWRSVAIDWRGQGLSARLLDDPAMGHVVHFRDYQKDVAALSEFIVAEDLSGPFFLIAHSMGGAIGLGALHEGLAVRAAAFSAPMWGIHLTARQRPMAWALALAARALGLEHRYAPSTSAASYLAEADFAGNLLTSDPESWAWMQSHLKAHPELALGGPSIGWLREALFETRRLMRLPAPDVPALAFLGSEERVVDPRPVIRRMRSWPRGRLELVEGARHEIMMERPEIRRRFFDEADALFSAFL